MAPSLNTLNAQKESCKWGHCGRSDASHTKFSHRKFVVLHLSKFFRETTRGALGGTIGFRWNARSKFMHIYIHVSNNCRCAFEFLSYCTILSWRFNLVQNCASRQIWRTDATKSSWGYCVSRRMSRALNNVVRSCVRPGRNVATKN